MKGNLVSIRSKRFVFVREEKNQRSDRGFLKGLIYLLISLCILSLSYIFKDELKNIFKLSYRQEYNKILSDKEINKVQEALDIQQPNYKWKSGLSNINKPKKIIYHHAADKDMTPMEAHELHLKNGWEGIGYQFYIRKDGTIYRGRPEEAEGAHTKGQNNVSIGICLEGNFEEEEVSEEQEKALVDLSVYICLKYDIRDIVGHRDLGNTLCPGANTDVKKIRSEVLNKLKDFDIHEIK